MNLTLFVAGAALMAGAIVGMFVMAIAITSSDRHRGGGPMLDLSPAAARGELDDLMREHDDGWDWPVAPRRIS